MTALPARRKATRREELLEAAMRRFAVQGVRSTSVDDIVREAGAAKGTFYLYFASRDDIVVAVAERLTERIGEQMARSVRDRRETPADRIRGITAAMSRVAEDSLEADLVREIHRPENAPIHDRLSERILEMLAPSVAEAIRDGIADGTFDEQDADRAAAFVLGATSAVDSLVTEPAQLEAVSRDVDAFVLRGLGWDGGR